MEDMPPLQPLQGTEDMPPLQPLQGTEDMPSLQAIQGTEDDDAGTLLLKRMRDLKSMLVEGLIDEWDHSRLKREALFTADTAGSGGEAAVGRHDAAPGLLAEARHQEEEPHHPSHQHEELDDHVLDHHERTSAQQGLALPGNVAHPATTRPAFAPPHPAPSCPAVHSYLLVRVRTRSPTTRARCLEVPEEGPQRDEGGAAHPGALRLPDLLHPEHRHPA